jgi:bifunctional enzyme CysN/CysC/sulfate adenylyltransferase subunit 1
MPSASGLEIQDDFALFLEQNLNKELLRFTTAGSVDDGKSTLIGRLLHDSKTVYEDQLASVKKSRINRANGPIDFSLITDGLRAEREQGITIDVGYRYFATARRKFIIADTPGHEQYTRNMATGASTANLAVILIDGTKGLLPQTLRHAYITSLLGISSVVAAVNKMDLLEYREEKFLRLREDFLALAKRLGIADVQCIPISALAGDNVVDPSERMPWYAGPTLLEHLEIVPIAPPVKTQGVRFPVQYVIRPNATFRGFAGQLAGGPIRQGDVVTALPSGQQSRVESIVTYDGPIVEAFSPMSVTLKLEDEIDLSRGDMLVSQHDRPNVSQKFAAMLVWMHAQPLEIGRSYVLKHCGRKVRGRVTRVRHRVNIDTLNPEAAEQLNMNDIAAVELETNQALFFDSYELNRITGSLILIDPLTNATLGAGMIREDLSEVGARLPSQETLHSESAVTPLERHRRHGHSAAIILVNAGTALVRGLERALFDDGFEVMLVERNASTNSATAGWRMLHSAGFVVVYQNSSLGIEERLDLRAAAGDSFFDLAGLSPLQSDAEIIEQVRALAESLRIPRGTENAGEVV